MKNGVITSDILSMDYKIKRSSGSSSSSPATYTVSFDLNYEGATGALQTQSVNEGDVSVIPDDPERTNFVFMGWNTDKTNITPFNFDSKINSDYTLYAQWVDMTDTTDTDGDGLIDSLEVYFGTNKDKQDTDDDGLTDYQELNLFGYDPTSSDTDKNGVIDSEEDFDQDGLTNIYEIQNGLDPTSKDSDFDMISDWDEINTYGTNPLNSDTDGDGVSDGIEIECGTDPKKAETQFKSEATTGDVNNLTPVSASAKVTTDADGAGTISIEEVTSVDNPLISKSIAGYLGSAYDFSTEGTIQSAEITFNYDTALGNIGEDFQPRIYYVNEETGEFEELPNQTVVDGKVTATTTHFSTYILLNKVEFDKVWNNEIKPPVNNDEQNEKDHLDVVLVIDSSGSMTSNDSRNIRKSVAKEFVSKLGENDKAAVIDFDSYSRLYSEFTSNKEALNSAIDRIDSSGGTNLGKGIQLAIEQFNKSETYDPKTAYKYIIMLTDGDGSYNSSLTTAAYQKDIVIYTIGLGSGVKESVLKSMAEGTGGQYYFASTAENLYDIFDIVIEETIDYTTDSNNDGISDYYTKLINDGELLLNGSYDLVDVTDMYGEDNDDWDNDGLKNGEEIEVCVSGSRVYLKMYSHPLIKDTDGDKFSDYEEKLNGTPPLKYTDTGCTYLDGLENDGYYCYIDFANDRSILSNFNAFFMCNKKDNAKNLYIEYFYDYAPTDSINKNKDKIAAKKSREIYLNYAQSFANILKTAKNICSIADDVSKIAEGSIDATGTANSEEFVNKIKDKSIKVKGASAQIRKSRKAIIDAINLGKFKDDKVLKTILSDTESALNIFEEFNKEIGNYDSASEFSLKLTEKLNNLTSVISKGVGTTKMIYEGFKYIKLDNGFKKLSNEYKNFVKSKGVDISTATWVGVGVDLVSGSIDVWENCERYGKMKANRDAYLAYIDLLYHIANNAYDDYDRDAAREIAEIIADESWSMYDKQLADSNGKIVVSTLLEATFDIAAEANPYVALANAVYKIAKSAISVIGLSSNAHTLLNCRTAKSISDGCKYIINENVEKNNNFFSYDESVKEYVYSYIQQLAQSRIVGENYLKQRHKSNDFAAIVSRWMTKTGKDDIDEMFDILIGEIYSRANNLKLELSPNLPEYSKFCNYM